MIAARWGMLLMAALSVLVASGAMSAHAQASALRVEVTAVLGVLAPLFWPGRAATASGTAWRVVAWSAAVAASAAIVLFVLRASPWDRVASAGAMLMAILVPTHAAAAALERRWQAATDSGGAARELAGRVMAIVLAALGTLPLWLGPAAESLSARLPGITDFVLGLSPVTHLAVASGDDLLHNAWLYEHSNLAMLAVTTPALGTIAWSYAAACALLAIVALASRRPRQALN